MKIIGTPGSNPAFPDIRSRNVTLEGYQKHQLQLKKIPRDIEFCDEHGNPVFFNTKTIHTTLVTTSTNTSPIQGNDEKILRLQNDGESYTLNSIRNEFPTLSAQSAADCFRMGKTINQFRRLCYPLSYSPILYQYSDPTYSSISSLETEEAECGTLNVVTVPTDQTQDDEEEDEDDHIFRIDTNIDHYRLCRAKTAHDSVLGKIDASSAKKPLTITEAHHLDTKALISKLDEVAKIVDLDVSTILAEQIKDPVLGTVRCWILKQISPNVKSPEIQQSKGLLRYCQELDRLLIETKGQLLCYIEPSDKLHEENLRICLPLSLSSLLWPRTSQ